MIGLTNSSRIFVTFNIQFQHPKTLKTLQTPASKQLTPFTPVPHTWTPDDTHIYLQDPQNISSCFQASLRTNEDQAVHLITHNPYQCFTIFFKLILQIKLQIFNFHFVCSLVIIFFCDAPMNEIKDIFKVCMGWAPLQNTFILIQVICERKN